MSSCSDVTAAPLSSAHLSHAESHTYLPALQHCPLLVISSSSPTVVLPISIFKKLQDEFSFSKPHQLEHLECILISPPVNGSSSITNASKRDCPIYSSPLPPANQSRQRNGLAAAASWGQRKRSNVEAAAVIFNKKGK